MQDAEISPASIAAQQGPKEDDKEVLSPTKRTENHDKSQHERGAEVEGKPREEHELDRCKPRHRDEKGKAKAPPRGSEGHLMPRKTDHNSSKDLSKSTTKRKSVRFESPKGASRPKAHETPGEREFRHAVVDGKADRVELLIRETDRDPNAVIKLERATPLHLAASKGHHDVLEILLKAGAYVDPVDRHDITPLHDAALRGHVKCLQLLIDAGADINHRDVDGCTALHKAAASGHTECIDVLLSKEAKIDSPDNEGTTALLRAVAKARVGTTELLLERGASVAVRDVYGQTVVHKAALAGNVALLKILKRTGVLIDAEDKNGVTPYLLSAASGDDAALRFFLRSGINKFKKTKNLWSAPHFAANEGHPDILLHLLLDGVPLSERDIWGRTPLHISVEAKTYTCANFLLQSGENPLVKDKFKRSAVKLAKSDPEMWQIFESHRMERNRIHEEEQRMKKEAKGMFAEFFGDLIHNTFAFFSSFIPFLPFSYGARAASTHHIGEGINPETGNGPNGEEQYINELYFKLLQEELDGDVADNGDYLSARFVLVHQPVRSTVRDIKGRLFEKYGLPPEKIRLCKIVDLPPQPASSSQSGTDEEKEEEYDAEIQTLPDSSTLAEHLDAVMGKPLLFVGPVLF